MLLEIYDDSLICTNDDILKSMYAKVHNIDVKLVGVHRSTTDLRHTSYEIPYCSDTVSTVSTIEIEVYKFAVDEYGRDYMEDACDILELMIRFMLLQNN